jgi:peptidoglycan hydrolase-like protein with peptidoglycan-binding domain
MRSSVFNKSAAVAMALLLASVPASAQRPVLPAGTVITVKTTVPLQSSTMTQGQTFEAVIDEDLVVDQMAVIPSGSRVRGVVALVTKATRQESGVLDIVFDRLILVDGSAFAIQGKLTSTDTVERRQIDANPSQRVVLVGGRGGIGAAIAGAGGSSSRNNILGALGAMLSEGMDVNVPAGTALAVELERAVTLRGRGRMVAYSGGSIYTAADRIRAAQTALSRLGYYRGSISGTLTDETRRALFEYQVDRGLQGTGNLDGRTAQALGLNVTGGLSGAVLTAESATALRRDAQTLVTRQRTELSASAVGRLDAARGYTQGDLELWFALSAFADNASLYEQVIRNGNNPDATVLAGKGLVAAMRRVDAAMPTARASVQLQNAWATLRRQLAALESGT